MEFVLQQKPGTIDALDISLGAPPFRSGLPLHVVRDFASVARVYPQAETHRDPISIVTISVVVVRRKGGGDNYGAGECETPTF